MKLTDLGCAAESEYRDLKKQIDRLPDRKTLLFEDCALPPGSVPAKAAVCFYKDGARYAMCLDRPFHGAGDNPALLALKDGETVFFQDFAMLRHFFEELSLETSSHPLPAAPQGAAAQDEYDLDSIVNMDEITIPTGAAQTAYDYKSIQRELEKIVMGQETAIETIAYQTALFLNKKNSPRPLSIMAYGPPGTGKSETAKALAKVLSKLGTQQYSEVWTDLNQFTEAHSIHKLIGSPPGYVGYSDRPILARVNDNKYTIFHWDEADKCHPDILKLMLSILDEGRCTANQEREGSNQLHFEHCIFIFTSNFKLGEPSSKGKIGFSFTEDVESIRHNDEVEISYAQNTPEDVRTAITMRIFRSTEAARKAFVEAGVLPEISSRFNCFCQFHSLSDEAKVKILVKMLIETGFEYSIRVTYISSAILQSLIDAATSENTLTVRSFRALIEGYLAAAFSQAGAKHAGQTVRLEGTLAAPVLSPS